MKLFYRPSLISLIIDLMILVLSVVVVFEWFPLTTQNPYEKYDGAGLLYFGLWAVFSYLCHFAYFYGIVGYILPFLRGYLFYICDFYLHHGDFWSVYGFLYAVFCTSVRGGI